MLLYRDRADQAARFSELGKAQSLYRAWAAVIRKNKSAGTLIKAVDARWRKEPVARCRHTCSRKSAATCWQ